MAGTMVQGDKRIGVETLLDLLAREVELGNILPTDELWPTVGGTGNLALMRPLSGTEERVYFGYVDISNETVVMLDADQT